jgi:acetoin utilization deacetylase AcuC-like enzyme
MSTLLISHAACLKHRLEPGHLEVPGRLEAVMQALEAPGFAGLLREEAPLATSAQIKRVHPQEHILHIQNTEPESGLASIDFDTHMSPGSWEAALRAAGAGVRAVDAVMGGEATNAFCAVRPPGHHGEPMRAMGFCLFNNVAIAARHAMAQHGAERIAIVDFDIHHGNGTQAAFWSEPNVLYASTHMMPHYPGTGAASETGAGNIFNAPLRAGDDGKAFAAAMREVILPALDAFRPDMVMISAGFDAHIHDPLGGLRLSVDDFVWITRELCSIGEHHAKGRVISFLEGGYDLTALARCAAAHVETLMQA